MTLTVSSYPLNGWRNPTALSSATSALTGIGRITRHPCRSRPAARMDATRRPQQRRVWRHPPSTGWALLARSQRAGELLTQPVQVESPFGA